MPEESTAVDDYGVAGMMGSQASNMIGSLLLALDACRVCSAMGHRRRSALGREHRLPKRDPQPRHHQLFARARCREDRCIRRREPWRLFSHAPVEVRRVGQLVELLWDHSVGGVVKPPTEMHRGQHRRSGNDRHGGFRKAVCDVDEHGARTTGDAIIFTDSATALSVAQSSMSPALRHMTMNGEISTSVAHGCQESAGLAFSRTEGSHSTADLVAKPFGFAK